MLLKNFFLLQLLSKRQSVWFGLCPLFLFVFGCVYVCEKDSFFRRIVFETDCVGEKVDSEILCYLKLQVAGTVRQILNLSWLAFSQQFFYQTIQICIFSSNNPESRIMQTIKLPWNCLWLGEIEKQFPELSCSAWIVGTIYIPDICQFWYTTALFRPAKSTPPWKKYTTTGCDGCDKYQLWQSTVSIWSNM